ncbi:MAG: TIGR03936 family radical SAM-associated protein, partial [Eubacterium sp.]|nr:TIGR03936 family radical SAM-associated protein [Eubacterium sp.]
MKARIKFTKTGPIKYIGHLDTMRYFQKALRRAAIPVTLSEGFSPHMLMSFASPLGVGKTSSGEYFDVDLKEEMTSREIVDRLNAQMVEGVEVLS